MDPDNEFIDYRKQIARQVLDMFGGRMTSTLVHDLKTAQKWLKQWAEGQAANARVIGDEPVLYRTCVRPGDKTVHMQLRAPADVMDRLEATLVHDDTDEEMCDDWTDWEEV